MKLVSTRGKGQALEASQATIAGIAPDGGLYVPSSFPKINAEEFLHLEYAELVAKILGLFYDDIDELGKLTSDAYAVFDNNDKAPIVKLGEDEYVMELWHGPTLAFKDMALSILPRLMTAALRINGGKDVLILVATSGDTGKAALEGFCDVDGTRIVVFYPSNGVSDMQKLQMTTQGGSNTKVIGIDGNFDDAQNGVKEIFADEEFAKAIDSNGYRLSSANSINFGRLAPQIAYYVWAYANLRDRGEVNSGEKINFVVPTGNFGNILAAYYAKRMGLPIGKLICASNKNNILTDFFRQGEYNLDRQFYKTMSPSMDILISSNLERLLFELSGRDQGKVSAMMSSLKTKQGYKIDGAEKEELEKDFYADWCGEEETMDIIKRTFDEKGYLIDTHTAVAFGVYKKYKENGDKTKTVIVSTASPYKFPQDVLTSLGVDTDGMDVFEMAEKLSNISKTQVPAQISELMTKKEIHTDVIDKSKLRQAVIESLK